MFKADTLYFTPGSVVADHREPADRLMLVAMGSVDLFVYPPDHDVHSARVSLRPAFRWPRLDADQRRLPSGLPLGAFSVSWASFLHV